MDLTQMRTWAECSESALTGNIRKVKAMLGTSKLMGIVKANAYGHGAVRAAGLFASEGADCLAVATLPEAIELREAGISCPILILGPTNPSFTNELISYNLMQTIVDFDTAGQYSKAAQKAGKKLVCHIKLDSGMGRLGFVDVQDAVRTTKLDNLIFDGALSHFAVSDDPDGSEYTLSQLKIFKEAVYCIEQDSGAKFRVLHIANSGGTENFSVSHLDMARPGIVIYGYPSSGNRVPGIEPVMELKSRIVQIKKLNFGDSVSYGRRYVADKKITVAVLPVGYADGLSRSLSNKLNVLINGKEAHQIGTICMDMCMIDVTGIESVEVGSVMTVFGREPGFTAADMARLRGTIPYEVLCNISSRVPRVWVK